MKLYDIISEEERRAIKHLQLRNSNVDDLTVDELHLMCNHLDHNKPYDGEINAVRSLKELYSRIQKIKVLPITPIEYERLEE